MPKDRFKVTGDSKVLADDWLRTVFSLAGVLNNFLEPLRKKICSPTYAKAGNRNYHIRAACGTSTLSWWSLFGER
tara:strand:+ start:183 stop:407 length:225 start_codon:yes stop_codon:yes gene_type:complete